MCHFLSHLELHMRNRCFSLHQLPSDSNVLTLSTPLREKKTIKNYFFHKPLICKVFFFFSAWKVTSYQTDLWNPCKEQQLSQKRIFDDLSEIYDHKTSISSKSNKTHFCSETLALKTQKYPDNSATASLFYTTELHQ